MATDSAQLAHATRLQQLWTLTRDSVNAWLDHNASSLGASLAYYTLFSIAPILVIAVAVAGYVFGPHVAETQVLGQMQALIGDAGAEALRGLLRSAQQSQARGLAAVVSVITLLIGATSVFGELQKTLDQIWEAPARDATVAWWRVLRSRLLSVGLILGVGFLLMVSLLVSAALAALGMWLNTFVVTLHVILPALDLTLSVALTTLLFAMIYKYVPRESIAWSDVWVGGFVTAVLFTIGKALIGLYLGRSSVSSAYGAAGSVMVLLLWIYYSAQIFLLGAEFTRVFAYTHGSRSQQQSAGMSA